MLILAVDPSSTRTGWAVTEGERVVAFGALSGKAGMSATARIEAMGDGLRAVAGEHGPFDCIVIETPSGKVNHNRNQGGGSGLSTYGMAAGYLWRVLVEIESPINIETVTAEHWTRGMTKDKRKRIAANYAPDYAHARDAGGDMADAISLGIWRFKQAEKK